MVKGSGISHPRRPSGSPIGALVNIEEAIAIHAVGAEGVGRGLIAGGESKRSAADPRREENAGPRRSGVGGTIHAVRGEIIAVACQKIIGSQIGSHDDIQEPVNRGNRRAGRSARPVVLQHPRPTRAAVAGFPDSRLGRGINDVGGVGAGREFGDVIKIGSGRGGQLRPCSARIGGFEDARSANGVPGHGGFPRSSVDCGGVDRGGALPLKDHRVHGQIRHEVVERIPRSAAVGCLPNSSCNSRRIHRRRRSRIDKECPRSSADVPGSERGPIRDVADGLRHEPNLVLGLDVEALIQRLAAGALVKIPKLDFIRFVESRLLPRLFDFLLDRLLLVLRQRGNSLRISASESLLCPPLSSSTLLPLCLFVLLIFSHQTSEISD